MCAGNGLLVKAGGSKIVPAVHGRTPCAARSAPTSDVATRAGGGLWAGGAIVREVLTVFSFRRPDAVDCRL